MAWGHCGVDDRGRPIGYMHDATCDHPDCLEDIDRGLSYVCGDMHGEDEFSCGKYFCPKHKGFFIEVSPDEYKLVCEDCHKLHMKQKRERK